MINPIQQNVVFKGVQNSGYSVAQDNFKGNVQQQAVSVRDNYLNAVKDVADVQNQVQEKIGNHTGKLNIIA